MIEYVHMICIVMVFVLLCVLIYGIFRCEEDEDTQSPNSVSEEDVDYLYIKRCLNDLRVGDIFYHIDDSPSNVNDEFKSRVHVVAVIVYDVEDDVIEYVTPNDVYSYDTFLNFSKKYQAYDRNEFIGCLSKIQASHISMDLDLLKTLVKEEYGMECRERASFVFES